jgi:hypothetical protein
VSEAVLYSFYRDVIMVDERRSAAGLEHWNIL